MCAIHIDSVGRFVEHETRNTKRDAMRPLAPAKAAKSRRNSRSGARMESESISANRELMRRSRENCPSDLNSSISIWRNTSVCCRESALGRERREHGIMRSNLATDDVDVAVAYPNVGGQT